MNELISTAISRPSLPRICKRPVSQNGRAHLPPRRSPSLPPLSLSLSLTLSLSWNTRTRVCGKRGARPAVPRPRKRIVVGASDNGLATAAKAEEEPARNARSARARHPRNAISPAQWSIEFLMRRWMMRKDEARNNGASSRAIPAPPSR